MNNSFYDDQGTLLKLNDLVSFFSPMQHRVFYCDVSILDGRWILSDATRRWDLGKFRKKLIDLTRINEGDGAYKLAYFRSKGYYLK